MRTRKHTQTHTHAGTLWKKILLWMKILINCTPQLCKHLTFDSKIMIVSTVISTRRQYFGFVRNKLSCGAGQMLTSCNVCATIRHRSGFRALLQREKQAGCLVAAGRRVPAHVPSWESGRADVWMLDVWHDQRSETRVTVTRQQPGHPGHPRINLLVWKR